MTGRAVAFLVLVVLLAGCGASYLETDDFGAPKSFMLDNESRIEDTPEHRAILKVVDEYRSAMTDRDQTRLRKLVATSYYENASTTDEGGDDYGNEKLDELFSDYLGTAVQEVRYDLEIKRLTHAAEMVYVDYAYAWSFRYKKDGRDHWKSKRNVNRLSLVQEGDAWKITGGM